MTALDFDTEARKVCADREQWWADMRAFNRADVQTGAMADALMRRSDEIDARVEQLRRLFFPRAHRLVIGADSAVTVSRTARSTRRVWSANGPQRG